MRRAVAWLRLGVLVWCVGCGAPSPAGSRTSAASPGSEGVASSQAVGSTASPMASAPGEPGGAASAHAGELEVDPFGSAPSTATKPCAVAGYRAPAGASLELVTRVRGTWLAVGLHNAGSAAVCAYSHIATHELQHDWLGVGYRDGASAVRLRFSDDRDKSAAVSVEIAPGATSWVSFDVAAWRSRRVNGSGALPRGRIELAVRYDTTGETWVWAGHLEAQTIMDAP